MKQIIQPRSKCCNTKIKLIYAGKGGYYGECLACGKKPCDFNFLDQPKDEIIKRILDKIGEAYCAPLVSDAYAGDERYDRIQSVARVELEKLLDGGFAHPKNCPQCKKLL